MQVGDLVRYAEGCGREHAYGVGLVLWIAQYDSQTCEILWADGTTCTHSKRWLTRIKGTS